MKTKIIAGLVAILIPLGAWAGNETGSGGDPLHFLFEDARVSAAARVRSAQECSFSVNVKTEVRDWIMQHKEALADDISSSRHHWITDAQSTCAFTQTASKADIILSYNVCRSGINDISGAIRLLVHESVHHFGIANEYFPDDVALAIYSLGVNSTCTAQPAADPFDPASCPGTHLSSTELKSMIPLPNSNERNLGRFTVNVRRRVCYGENWCGTWSESADEKSLYSDLGSAFYLKKQGVLKVEMKNNEPQIYLTGDPMMGAIWGAEAKFIDGIFSVVGAGGVRGKGTSSNNGYLVFAVANMDSTKHTLGWVTNSCLRMTASGESKDHDEKGNDIVVQYEGVILSSFTK